jgi:hypothetical protein
VNYHYFDYDLRVTRSTRGFTRDPP